MDKASIRRNRMEGFSKVCRMSGICFVFIFCGAGDQVPSIEEGKIVFVGGKTVTYESKKVLRSPSKEGLSASTVVSISEKPLLIRPWKRIIIVRTENLYEGSTVQILAYDYRGNLLGTSKKISGEAFFIEGKQRIFLGQKSSHYMVKESYIFDTDAKLIRVIPQSKNVVSFGLSEDGELIWIISSRVQDGKPVGEVQVVDSNGSEIGAFTFSKAQEIKVEHKGRTYKITTEAPDFPG